MSLDILSSLDSAFANSSDWFMLAYIIGAIVITYIILIRMIPNNWFKGIFTFGVIIGSAGFFSGHGSVLIIGTFFASFGYFVGLIIPKQIRSLIQKARRYSRC